jgi:hypothetical protein
MCLASSSPKYNGHLPLSVFRVTPCSCQPLLVITLFHFFISSNAIQYTAFYPKKSLFLYVVSMSFSPKILLNYFVFQHHYIYLSLPLCFSSLSYRFLHTNVSQIVYSFSVNFIVQLGTDYHIKHTIVLPLLIDDFSYWYVPFYDICRRHCTGELKLPYVFPFPCTSDTLYVMM